MNVYVGKAGAKGRGVFAGQTIGVGEVIESCPVVLIPNEELAETDTLNNYVFRWNQRRFAVPLGYGALYNHSDDPNADVLRYYDDRLLEVRAVRSIASGEEITIRYGWEDKELALLVAQKEGE